MRQLPPAMSDLKAILQHSIAAARKAVHVGEMLDGAPEMDPLTAAGSGRKVTGLEEVGEGSVASWGRIGREEGRGGIMLVGAHSAFVLVCEVSIGNDNAAPLGANRRAT